MKKQGWRQPLSQRESKLLPQWETTLLLIQGNEQMKKPEISVLPRMEDKVEKNNT